MKICRYVNADNQVHIGLAKDDKTLLDLTAAEVESITSIMENDDPEKFLSDLKGEDLPEVPLNNVNLLCPIEMQEVWAAAEIKEKGGRVEPEIMIPLIIGI